MTRPLWYWPAGAGITVMGVALGIGGSVVWPWGWAPAPAAQPETPRPGMLLMSESDYAIVGQVEHTAEHALGLVTFVRGRSGRLGAIARCIEAPGRRLVLELGTERTDWLPSGETITDLIGRALCADHASIDFTRS